MKMKNDEENRMNIIAADKPSIAIETAVMLYRHAQEIVYQERKNRFYVKAVQSLKPEALSEISKTFDEMAAIEKRICKNISDEDENFKYFFSDNGTDVHGPDALLGRSVATALILSLMDPCISGYVEQAEHIKRVWGILKKNGYLFNNYTRRFEILNYPGISMDENYLLGQVEQLSYSDEFKYKLFKAFTRFDETVDEIFEYMHPFAVKLGKELDYLSEARKSALEYWKNALNDECSCGLAQNSFAALGIDEATKKNVDIRISVLMCESNVLNIGWDVGLEAEGKKQLNFICGFDIRNHAKLTKANADPGFYFGIMKVLSDSSKLKMLRKMSKKAYLCSTLAAELGLDAGNTSRNLKTLNELGFLICEKQGGRMSYRTDDEAVRYILNSIQNFILDEGTIR